MTYRIDRVDPADAAGLHEWFRVFDIAEHHDRGADAPVWLENEITVRANNRAGDEDRTYLRARDDATGRIVAVAEAALPLLDNTHVVGVGVWTLPEARRRGAASALLAEVERLARAAGRCTVMGEVTAEADGTDRAAGRFAAARGFTKSLVEVRRDLDLPVAESLLDRLEAEARMHATGYSVVTYVDRLPPHLRDGRARLAQRISTDAPLGDLDWHEERWDAARVERATDELAEMDRRLWGAAALTVDGAMVGVTEIVSSQREPAKALQWDTIVDRDHRGHRLGLLLKVVNLRAFQCACPQARLLYTWNAADNRHMVSINERLGFRPAEQNQEWQKTLP